MPDLFPNVAVLVLCALVVAGAQFIYATVGFGAGMFSIALLAMLLPDLAPAVATLLLLTLVTEVWVLARSGRHARMRLLLGLLPTTAVGMWLGTEMLAGGDVTGLKRALGVMVACAGAWFFFGERRNRTPAAPADAAQPQAPHARSRLPFNVLACMAAGLAAGALAGLFGTGGPPVIICLKSHRLDKAAFRATLLWYFLLMSIFRGAAYLRAGLLTDSELTAALWLLPASLLGMVAGSAAHHRLSERHFAVAVSGLLIILGGLLLIGGGQ